MKADRFLRLTKVLELVDLGRSRFYELVHDGKAPAPVRIDGDKGAARWSANELQAWMSRLKRQRDQRQEDGGRS